MEEDHYLESCYHGGAFFDAIGARFDRIDRAFEVINADVLDAWFPPAPGVISQIQAALSWIARTSPPTNCEGLIEAIAQYRRVPESAPAVGASPIANNDTLCIKWHESSLVAAQRGSLCYGMWPTNSRPMR